MMRAVRKRVAESMFRATITTLSDLEAMFAAMPQQFSGGELPEELIAVLQARAMQMQAQQAAMSQSITVNNGGFDNGENFSVPAPQAAPLQPAVRLTPKVGANDPCPCGSGKK